MRTVVAWPVATVVVLALLAPAAAAPPTDVGAYCRATYPHLPFQIRCLNLENAAAARVARAGAATDRAVFEECLDASPSWAAMESCVASSASGEPSGGASNPTTPTAAPAPAQSDPGAAGSEPPGAAAAPSPAPDASTAGLSSPSTVILGPRISPAAAAPEANRPTRPISEADADRHLRGILERAGIPTARCTKKQYGPGWVSICE